MARLILKIELTHVGASEADLLKSPKSATFEYDSEKQALLVFNLLTTRDCAADKVEVWLN